MNKVINIVKKTTILVLGIPIYIVGYLVGLIACPLYYGFSAGFLAVRLGNAQRLNETCNALAKEYSDEETTNSQQGEESE